jgi:hypothetical protein
MFQTMTAAAKTKALLAALSLLFLGGLVSFSMAWSNGFNPNPNQDPYTLDIQERADKVNNAVLGVVDAQGKQEAWQFKQTCENAVYIIRKQNLEAQQEATTLSPDQRAVNEQYRDFLHEAYLVVDDCYNGKQADLLKMAEAKAKLI